MKPRKARRMLNPTMCAVTIHFSQKGANCARRVPSQGWLGRHPQVCEQGRHQDHDHTGTKDHAFGK